MDGLPKDYSKLDQEETRWSDGSISVPRHREGVDLAAVARRLRSLPTNEIAMDSLRNHYCETIVRGKKHQQPPLPPIPPRYKVVINYVDEKEIYIIYVPQNTTDAIKSLAPKKGSFRYFFELEDGSFEETDVNLHVNPKGGTNINCRVFRR